MRRSSTRVVSSCEWISRTARSKCISMHQLAQRQKRAGGGALRARPPPGTSSRGSPCRATPARPLESARPSPTGDAVRHLDRDLRLSTLAVLLYALGVGLFLQLLWVRAAGERPHTRTSRLQPRACAKPGKSCTTRKPRSRGCATARRPATRLRPRRPTRRLAPRRNVLRRQRRSRRPRLRRRSRPPQERQRSPRRSAGRLPRKKPAPKKAATTKRAAKKPTSRKKKTGAEGPAGSDLIAEARSQAHAHSHLTGGRQRHHPAPSSPVRAVW